MNTRPIQTPGFTNLMSRGEIIAAVIYLPLHVVGIPLGLGYLSQVWPALAAMTDTEINLAYYGVGLDYMLVLLRGFLRRSFDAALDAKGNFFVGVAGGYAVDIGLSFILSSVLLVLSLDLGMAPNNEAILAGAAADRGKLAVMSVVMAPIVEEPLFRGLLFGCIRPRSRAAAYIVSALLFSLYHVWQFVFISGDFGLLIYCLLYLPVSIGLAWAYDRSGSIWAAMLMHGIVNAVSLSVLESGMFGY